MKYAVYTKWAWDNGVPSAGDLKSMMRSFRDAKGGDFAPEEVLWWQIDETHHQAVIIYPSKEIADAERKALEAARKESVQDNKNKMVEEYVGPIVMQLTEL
jgi:hypothetical protein